MISTLSDEDKRKIAAKIKKEEDELAAQNKAVSQPINKKGTAVVMAFTASPFPFKFCVLICADALCIIPQNKAAKKIVFPTTTEFLLFNFI